MGVRCSGAHEGAHETPDRNMIGAGDAAAMVVLSGPDPKGAKAQQQSFHNTSNGIMSISASGAICTPCFAPPHGLQILSSFPAPVRVPRTLSRLHLAMPDDMLLLDALHLQGY